MEETPVVMNNPQEMLLPVPRISLQAFCETSEVAELIATAAEDRRMDKAHVRVQMGGAPGAVEAYRTSPTPNVVILETLGRRNEILGYLDELAEVCDAATKVIVIGHVNDIVLYRELVARGVSDYLIQPIAVLDVVRAISGLFANPGAKPVGRTIAVIGAKGGVGASTIAHNVAWAISKEIGVDACIVDMDMPFGTGGLDFNQDPPQGIAEAVFSPDRVDTAFIDRLLSRCSNNLSLMAAPATLDRVYDLGADAFDPLMDVLRSTVPAIVLDLPHGWCAWTKRLLTMADEILVVAGPDLANLRNAKNLVDLLRQARPNDAAPRYMLNQVGLAKRPEIKPSDFAKALESEPLAVIGFDAALFGTAANNGQMVSELDPANKISGQFIEIALAMMGRNDVRKPKQGLLAQLTPLIGKLGMRKKA